MREFAVALGVLVAMLLTSCATQQYSERPSPERPSLEGSADDGQQATLCRPGFYFCPGKVVGCCPNGWGCASTHCIRPKAKPKANRKAVDRTCRPGYYFCPGEVMGCCPNGWGCASTHCVKPPRRLDL